MEVIQGSLRREQLTNQHWWARHRTKYNKGLVVAGIAAFFVYAIVGSIFLGDSSEFEITIFTTLFQGFGYLIIMGIANVFYNLGPFVDSLFNKSNDEAFKQRLFNLGYWFSVGLPFLIPVLLIATSYANR